MKIFVLLSRVPYPLEKGDKLRAFNQIKRLGTKHEIILCALNIGVLHPKALDKLKPYCKNITIIQLSGFNIFINLFKTLFSKLPFQVGYFYNHSAHQKIKDIISNQQPDIIYCQLIRTSEYVKNISSIPKVLDFMDVFSEGIKRRIKKSSLLMKPFLLLEYKRLIKYESSIFNFFNKKIIISEQDRSLMQHSDKSSIIVIPNGVDVNYFQPLNSKKEFDLLFTGNMNYPPNIYGAIFLVQKIMPLVRKQFPDLSLLLAGANPSPRIKLLGSTYTKVSGWVEDIRECYSKSRIFIAPMQIGTGLQNKLLEAMAMKLPCITSPLVNKALNAPINDCILIANTPQQYAEHILFLIENPEKANAIVKNAHNFVVQNYNWDEYNLKLEEVLSSATVQ